MAASAAANRDCGLSVYGTVKVDAPHIAARRSIHPPPQRIRPRLHSRRTASMDEASSNRPRSLACTGRNALRILVLGSTESWYLADLRRAAADRHEIVAGTFRQIAASLDGDTVSIATGPSAFAAFDAVLVRTMAAGSLEQIVFRMDALARAEAAGQVVINPPRAVEAAVDKFLALARLREAGLPVPRTVVCQSSEQAMEAFAQLGGDVVIKPLFGAEGRGIARVNDEALLLRACRMLEDLRAVLYLQEFVPHAGYDIRALVVGHKVYGIQRRSETDWRTNISRGATAASCRLDSVMEDYALRAAAAVGAPIAGVDLLPARDGRLLVLEVNAVPGWRATAQALETDIAAEVLAYVEGQVQRHTP